MLEQRQMLSDATTLAYEARREAKACANGEWNEPVAKLGQAVDLLATLVRVLFDEVNEGRGNT
jgi:hypothetical protein